jgi:hypothetical protein
VLTFEGRCLKIWQTQGTFGIRKPTTELYTHSLGILLVTSRVLSRVHTDYISAFGSFPTGPAYFLWYTLSLFPSIVTY